MNKVTFRCIRSGNTVSFTNENDIAGLREHEGYVEVKDVETAKTVQIEPPKETSKKVLKIKPKAVIPAFLQE